VSRPGPRWLTSAGIVIVGMWAAPGLVTAQVAAAAAPQASLQQTGRLLPAASHAAAAQAATTAARSGSAVSVGGLVFGDFYGVPSSHLRDGDGSGGMRVRRGYLTFDGEFGDRWFGRLRFELNQAGTFDTYTFDLAFKDLYAGLRVEEHRLLFGLSPTPTFDSIENVWGLRYLARTPLDMQGVPSRDTGVAARGPLNGSGSLSYRAMAGVGAEFGNESGDGVKWMGALNWRPSSGWAVDLYADYEKREGETDRSTLQGFLSYSGEAVRWGAQYSNQDRQDEAPLELLSGFVVADLSDDTSLVGRVDRLLEPSPKGDDIAYIPFDPSSRATLLLGAVEFRVREWFSWTPNVLFIVYDRNQKGMKPPTDAYLRLTFFLDLE
jgi:hypothetical protein